MNLSGIIVKKQEIQGALHSLSFIHGESAYELALLNGFKGTEAEWLESLKGETYNLTVADKKDIAEDIVSEFEGEVGDVVSEWLSEHPEATTTVQDRSLTAEKMMIGALGYITPQMFGAKADGVTDDSEAIQKMIDFATPETKIFFPKGVYIIHPYASLGYRVGDALNSPSSTKTTHNVYGNFGVVFDKKSNLEIEFSKGAVLKSVKNDFNNNSQASYFFYLYKCENIKINGGEFVGEIDDLPTINGNPEDLTEAAIRNQVGVTVSSCTDIDILNVYSHNWRSSPIKIGGDPKSNNITIDGCLCHDSYYHALEVEGADDVVIRNTKAYRADTGTGSVFGTSADIEGASIENPNENIIIEGCEFGYSQTSSLNIIKCRNVIVRNCIIKDKPLTIQNNCYSIDIVHNSIYETNVEASKYALGGIIIDNNFIKNGCIRFTATENANYGTNNFFISNNLIELEDDIYTIDDNGKRVYARNKMACIDLSLKNNSCINVSNNTVAMKNGNSCFAKVVSSADSSSACFDNNRFIVGSKLSPVTDMYYIMFNFNRANVDFMRNNINIYCSDEMTSLNDDGSHTTKKPILMYLTGSNGTTNEHIDIGYNKFNVLTLSLNQPYYIQTSGTSGVTIEDYCRCYSNLMNSVGVSSAYAFSTYATYGYEFINNIINVIHAALYTKTDKVTSVNNIVNGEVV
jgi:hypothetical protein